jgi:hypothetical protein
MSQQQQQSNMVKPQKVGGKRKAFSNASSGKSMGSVKAPMAKGQATKSGKSMGSVKAPMAMVGKSKSGMPMGTVKAPVAKANGVKNPTMKKMMKKGRKGSMSMSSVQASVRKTMGY